MDFVWFLKNICRSASENHKITMFGFSYIVEYTISMQIPHLNIHGNFEFFPVLFVLAENSIPFLATILPFPLIIIIASLSVCILDLSVTAADKDKGNHSCTKSNTRGK